MKTLRTIATVLLAAFLVLGPVAAFGASSTITVQTGASSYTYGSIITITGTVTPAPAAGTNAIITTDNSAGMTADIASQPVSSTTGSYSYSVTAGGSPAWTSGTYTVTATALGASASATFVYNAGGGSGNGTTSVITITSTTTFTTAVSTATVTTTVPSSDAASLQQLQVSLNGITSTLTAIQTSLTSLTSAVNTISQGVTGLTSQLTAISGNISTVNGIGTQLTSLNSAVNNNQTYVLVVAALAAITLVLELAILVRKLS